MKHFAQKYGLFSFSVLNFKNENVVVIFSKKNRFLNSQNFMFFLKKTNSNTLFISNLIIVNKVLKKKIVMLKNVAGSSFDEINLENGFHILEFQNESDETLRFERNIDSTFIQIHFCVRGHSKFLFNTVISIRSLLATRSWPLLLNAK